jgi:PAS domain S-box-containing protein
MTFETTLTTRPTFGIGNSLTDQSRYVNKRPIVILSIVLALIVSTVFYVFWCQAASVIHTSEQLSRTKDVLSCLDNTLSTLRDAESCERGYVVTADPAYLKPYYRSREQLNKQMIKLRGFATTADSKQQYADLEHLMRAKVAEMDKTVIVRTPQNYRDSWLLMVRGREKQIMDEISAAIAVMKVNEEASATRAANSVRDANRTILTMLPILMIIAGVMVSLLVFFCFKFKNEKKLANLRLSHSYKLFESFMDNSPGFAFIKDRQGKYIYVNRSLEARFVLDGEPIAGRRDVDWLPAKVAAEVRANDEKVLSSNTAIQTIQALPNKQTGVNETWVVFKFPIVDLINNNFVGGFAIDVSEMKKAEQQIAELNEDLQARVTDLELIKSELEMARDQAMSASTVKSQFIANMSHEIRTPMSGVLGMSELLLESELDEEPKELVSYINSSAKNLLDVVNDLLDFAKLEAGRVVLDNSPFSLTELLRDAINSVAPAAQKKNLNISCSVAADVPEEVLGDQGRLRQVLLNLTHNAVKFTSSGNIDASVNLVASTDKNILVSFEVHDTGIGITPESQQKLFEPFVQADGSTTRQYGGTGLGLSICKSLVELMDGRIGVRSEPDHGSTFWFTIPLQVPAARGEAEAA